MLNFGARETIPGPELKVYFRAKGHARSSCIAYTNCINELSCPDMAEILPFFAFFCLNAFCFAATAHAVHQQPHLSTALLV
jgi:hypothetical protein